MDVLCNTLTEAQAVLNALVDQIRQHTFVTVGALHRLTDQDSTYADAKVGWGNLRDATITQGDTYCTLTLPEPIEHAVFSTKRVMAILEGMYACS